MYDNESMEVCSDLDREWLALDDTDGDKADKVFFDDFDGDRTTLIFNGGTRENLVAVATEEVDSLTGFGFHDSFSLLSELICVEGKEKLELEDSRKREN